MDQETLRKKVDKIILIRQIIFILVVVVVIILTTLNVLAGKIGATLAISGFLLATIVGLIFSRVFNIFWHPTKAKVVARLDAIGISLLIVYVGIELSRKWIFQYWLKGAALNAFVLVILGGLLLGRFIGTQFRIHSLLRKNK